ASPPDLHSFPTRRSSDLGRPIDLGPTEYRLLEFFLEHPGRVFSREQLLDSVWGRDIYIDERTVDVHIGRLRKLLNSPREQDPIRSEEHTSELQSRENLVC